MRAYFPQNNYSKEDSFQMKIDDVIIILAISKVYLHVPKCVYVYLLNKYLWMKFVFNFSLIQMKHSAYFPIFNNKCL